MKYAPIKLRAGAYAVLSDDRRTLYAVRAVEEDGSLETGDGRKIVGQFWSVCRLGDGRRADQYVRRNDDGTFAALDTRGLADDWDAWDELSTLHLTKREALAVLDERYLSGTEPTTR